MLSSAAPTPELSLVMPCYNESEIIEEVLKSWSAKLAETTDAYEIIVINDGSSDGSGRILDRIRKDIRNLRIIHQLNSGHDQAVRRGYELARGRFIFQVDSNGLYSPDDFTQFWERRNSNQLLLGYRTQPVDGFIRPRVLKLLRSWIRLLFGSELQDPNVPFRLFRRDAAMPHLARLPADWAGVNIALSILLQREFPLEIAEIPLPFHPRRTGKLRAPLRVFLNATGHYFVELAHLRLRRRHPQLSGRLPSEASAH